MKIMFIVLTSLFFISLFGLVIAGERAIKLMFECTKASAIALIVFAIISDIILDEPRAIDVYQGKTTLQVTYQDGIAVDSVVVFKVEEQK